MIGVLLVGAAYVGLPIILGATLLWLVADEARSLFGKRRSKTMSDNSAGALCARLRARQRHRMIGPFFSKRVPDEDCVAAAELIAELTLALDRVESQALAFPLSRGADEDVRMVMGIADISRAALEKCGDLRTLYDHHALAGKLARTEKSTATIAGAVATLSGSLVKSLKALESARAEEREKAARIARGFEPTGAPDAEFCAKRPDEGRVIQELYDRTMAIAEAILHGEEAPRA